MNNYLKYHIPFPKWLKRRKVEKIIGLQTGGFSEGQPNTEDPRLAKEIAQKFSKEVVGLKTRRNTLLVEIEKLLQEPKLKPEIRKRLEEIEKELGSPKDSPDYYDI